MLTAYNAILGLQNFNKFLMLVILKLPSEQKNNNNTIIANSYIKRF